MITEAWVIVPVGTSKCAARIDAGVNVYVAVPSAFTTGVTLLQPRKYVFTVVTMLKRGEPPWHWLALFSVNDPDKNGCPFISVIRPYADAGVEFTQLFSRCRHPFCAFATGQPVLFWSKVPGTSAAPAVP